MSDVRHESQVLLVSVSPALEEQRTAVTEVHVLHNVSPAFLQSIVAWRDGEELTKNAGDRLLCSVLS